MEQEINFVALVKPGGREVYIFFFDDESANMAGTLRFISKFASNPQLSLDLYDAAALSDEIRTQLTEL